jgi:hypothetical protein
VLDKLTELPPGRRFAAILGLTVSLVIVGVAQRDLQRRSDEELRGPKLLWRVLCLNALGALAYFRWGRRA